MHARHQNSSPFPRRADAGDGDYVLKAMGQRAAAEPDNVPVRLELAKLYRERGYPEVALEICRLAAERFAESGEVQLALVRALYDMKRYQEGIAAHPGDIDVIWIYGYGFPVWRGGPMFYADSIGLRPIRDRLRELARTSGDKRHEPAALLDRLADEARGFGSLTAAKAAA